MKLFFGKKSRLAALLAVSVLGLASEVALAGTAVQTMGISATVGSNCIVTTTPIAFGVYDPLSATPLNGTGTVALICTTGAVPSIAVDNGLNVNVAQRRMINAGNYLNYDVYQPTTNAAAAACAYATPYPTVAPGFALTAAPSVASRSYNICGRVPISQSVPNATYSDTVSITVTF